MFPPEVEATAADVMVSVWNEDSFADSLALARELRDAGLRVDLYTEADKLGKQFKYASARGVAYVVVAGDEERAKGQVTIKDMRSGEQRVVARESAGAILSKELRRAHTAGDE